MLILKYFATVGTVLATFLLAVNAYLDPSGSNAAARVPSSMTTASVYLALPTTQPLATVTTVGTTAHTGCATSTCPTEEQPTPTRQVTEVTVQRRIENALKDLEIFNARAFATDAMLEGRIEHALKDLESATANAFKADQERMNEIARKAGIDR